MNTIKQAKICYIVSSLLLSVLGIIIIIKPHISALTLCYIVGGLTVFYGLTKIFEYISHDLYNLAFEFDLSLGIFTTLLGIIFICRASHIVDFFTIIIGAFIFLDGVFKLQTSIDAKRFGLYNWWIILIGALICVLLSVLLVLNPFSGSRFLMSLVGVAILIDGLQNLFNAVYTIKILKSDDKIKYKKENR